MSATHTPGPWQSWKRRSGGLLDYDICAHDELAFALAEVKDNGRDGQAEANARLIAAAPELLAACRLALAVHNGNPQAADTLGVEDPDNGPELLGKYEAFLRAAVAKATQTT